jgi:hypothetical protein
LWIQTGTIAGNGAIQANGAQGGNDNGGGGGRISIFYQTDTFAGTASAWGGAHGGNGDNGGAGTVYWKGAGALGNVVVDNNGQAGAYTPADLVNGAGLTVTLTNGAQVVVAGGETWSVNRLSVGPNCTVWCYSSNNTGQVNNQWVGAGVMIQAQNMVLYPGALITADGLGYLSGQGPGAGVRNPYAGGGGYAGWGARTAPAVERHTDL